MLRILLLEPDTNPHRHAKHIEFIDSCSKLTDNEPVKSEQHKTFPSH